MHFICIKMIPECSINPYQIGRYIQDSNTEVVLTLTKWIGTSSLQKSHMYNVTWSTIVMCLFSLVSFKAISCKKETQRFDFIPPPGGKKLYFFSLETIIKRKIISGFKKLNTALFPPSQIHIFLKQSERFSGSIRN